MYPKGNKSSCKTCVTRDTSIFSDIPCADLDVINEMIEERTCKKGEEIYYEGEKTSALYILKEGYLKLSKSLEDGRNQVVNILDASKIFGFESIYEEEYTESAEMLSSGMVCSIQKKKFQDFLEERPDISLKIIKVLNRNLKQAQERIRDLGLKTAQEKLASVLISFPYEEKDGVRKLSCPVTRQTIADMTGLTVETTIRTLSDFNKKGIIANNKRSITLLDVASLMNLAS